MQNVVSKAISQGVYIITVRSKEKINGMTAAWVSQVSLSPIMLLVSIAPARHTHNLIKESGYFAINVLSEGQKDIAKHFGSKSGRTINKFEGHSCFDAPKGSPVLEDAMAYFECKLIDTFKAGDHNLFVGEVLTAKLYRSDKKPLIFNWDDYF
jgi:flavin reductase (DIM6/NTAB) family NADH-FMN oxidoreductase RutF